MATTDAATIALAGPGDYVGFVRIVASFRAVGVADEAFMDERRFRVKFARGEVLTARVADTAVGYLSFTYLWSNAWIEYVRILEEHRGAEGSAPPSRPGSRGC